MSKEKSTKQMSLQEDFHANHSALQEKENQQQMIVTSGMKCLESLEKQNQDGLLEKMLKALLISTKAWYSDRCLMTWKTKVSKANVLLFQLQASVRGIKGNESGLSPNISNSNNNGSYRSQGNATKQSSNEQKDRLSFGDDKDVSNSNARLSIRENEEIQTRGNATTNGSEDVSNSDSWLCGGRGTELKSGDDREGWFYTEKEKQTREHIRCKTIGCNAILGKETTNKTWWQTQSELCGVPNGVSYELDKDRSNRIKALGNSIVPQIARQIGLSIMEAELNGKI